MLRERRTVMTLQTAEFLDKKMAFVTFKATPYSMHVLYIPAGSHAVM